MRQTESFKPPFVAFFLHKKKWLKRYYYCKGTFFFLYLVILVHFFCKLLRHGAKKATKDLEMSAKCRIFAELFS